MGTDSIPVEGYALALASLPAVGPARLRALVGLGPLPEAWDLATSGTAHRHPILGPRLGSRGEDLACAWAHAGRRLQPAEIWERHRSAGIGVAVLGTAGYPAALVDDPEPPVVLCTRGDPDLLTGPRVAVVGTRRCTRYGLDVARTLGHDLAIAGIRVVSGLALGIDGAAHAGALRATAAPPVAVVGSGLDVVYPSRNRGLWEQVERAGVMLSESPLGARPEPWRFPARNRIIAGLADVVVVVESGATGGSLHTVDEAVARDIPVMVVPGPITSAASAGTNRLLVDGHAPVADPADVLVALGMGPGTRRPSTESRPPPEPSDRPVLDALAWQPATLEQLALRTELDLGALALALARLGESGWVSTQGGWYERIARAEP